MVLWNLGSAQDVLTSEVESIPASLSGTPLNRMIDGVRLYMENYTGQSIGSTAIAEKYQPALIDLTKAQLYLRISEEGSDANSISIGPFSKTMGQGSNVDTNATQFKAIGMDELKILGKTRGYARIIAG